MDFPNQLAQCRIVSACVRTLAQCVMMYEACAHHSIRLDGDAWAIRARYGGDTGAIRVGDEARRLLDEEKPWLFKRHDLGKTNDADLPRTFYCITVFVADMIFMKVYLVQETINGGKLEIPFGAGERLRCGFTECSFLECFEG